MISLIRFLLLFCFFHQFAHSFKQLFLGEGAFAVRLLMKDRKKSAPISFEKDRENKAWSRPSSIATPPVDNQQGEKEWKSGQVFGKQTRNKRRNDPWWMRDEESNNPKIYPKYQP